MPHPSNTTGTWGSALALPLLLSLAASLTAGTVSIPNAEKPNLAGGVRYLMGGDTLGAAPKALGLPEPSTQWLLWGGGATIARPLLRAQASAWTGGLRAARGSDVTTWDLHLAELALEQTYPNNTLLITGGATANFAELHGTLGGPGGHSSVRAPLWGGGVSAGVRWPRQTALGFFVRGSWLWLMGQGDWRGDQAHLLGSQRFDLSGPSVTSQIELSF